MSKGLKRGNREAKKPKQKKAPSEPVKSGVERAFVQPTPKKKPPRRPAR